MCICFNRLQESDYINNPKSTPPCIQAFWNMTLNSSHLYLLWLSSAMWLALAKGKLVDLPQVKHGKALARFCFLSCSFASAWECVWAMEQSWTAPAVPGEAIWAHSTRGQPTGTWVSLAKPRRTAQSSSPSVANHRFMLNKCLVFSATEFGVIVTQRYCANR